MKASAAAFFLASKMAFCCRMTSTLGGGHLKGFLRAQALAWHGSAVTGAAASAEADAPALASGAPEAAPSVWDGAALLLKTMAPTAAPTLPFGVGINGGGRLKGLLFWPFGFGGGVYWWPRGLVCPSSTCGSSPGSEWGATSGTSFGSGSSSSGTSTRAAAWWTTGEGEIGAGAEMASALGASVASGAVGATESLGTSADVFSSTTTCAGLGGGVNKERFQQPRQEKALAQWFLKK